WPAAAASHRDRRLWLPAHTRPENLGRTQSLGHLTRDQVDQLATTDLQQLGSGARHPSQQLAVIRLVPGQRASIENPVRVATEQGSQGLAKDDAVEEQMDADDRGVIEGPVLTEQR